MNRSIRIKADLINVQTEIKRLKKLEIDLTTLLQETCEHPTSSLKAVVTRTDSGFSSPLVVWDHTTVTCQFCNKELSKMSEINYDASDEEVKSWASDLN